MNTEDLDLRIHHHSQMATAGLRRVIELCHSFNFEPLNTQLDGLQEMIENDEKDLRERLDQEILRDMTNIEDVYATLKSRTQNTKAYDYLLSILQHLLLVREDGPGLVQYYQLLDSLVTDVVMDHKLAGAEQRLGKSVEGIISQFNDAEQFRILEADAAKMRADLRRLQLEKETLEGEVVDGGDGLIGVLKSKVASLEEKLQISRETTARLQMQLETQKTNYEEQISQLEAQIMELFRMLKELGADGVGKILDNGNAMDRKTLLATLEKHMQRSKTISILEGRDSIYRKRVEEGQDIDGAESDDPDATPGKSRLKRQLLSQRGHQLARAARSSDGPNGRTSQFMDADEADVKEQIQQQLAAGVLIVSRLRVLVCCALLTPNSTHREMIMLPVHEASTNPRVPKIAVQLMTAPPPRGPKNLAYVMDCPPSRMTRTTKAITINRRSAERLLRRNLSHHRWTVPAHLGLAPLQTNSTSTSHLNVVKSRRTTFKRRETRLHHPKLKMQRLPLPRPLHHRRRPHLHLHHLRLSYPACLDPYLPRRHRRRHLHAWGNLASYSLPRRVPRRRRRHHHRLP